MAEALKERGNAHFRKVEYAEAEACYTEAIIKNSKNAVLFSNRANARLKLAKWEGVIDDCLQSIELSRENMKAFFFLGKFHQF
jgi:STIP1 family protein 1